MTTSRSEDLADRIARLSPEQREVLQQRLGETRVSGFEAVARSLRSYGITHIYGVAGLPTERLMPASAAEGIRPIHCCHHTSAVCMALAHNYQAGQLVAVALVSAGPAATNAITGLLVAHDNAWPVIVLGGNRTSFQKFDAIPLVQHVTKLAVDVRSADAIDECLDAAVEATTTGRPGPAYLQLHEDVLNANATWPPHDRSRAVPPTASVSDEQIQQVADALLSAGSPALILGKGARWTVAPDHLRELIELIDLPFITSPMGRGLVPDDHALCFNHGRRALQGGADVVLCLGTRLDWPFRHGAELSPDARVIRVDIEEDQRPVAPVTDFIRSDAGELVSRLLWAVQSRNPDRGARTEWLGILKAAREETRRTLAGRTGDDSSPMSPYRMMKEVRDALPRDAICITEGNISMMCAQPVISGYLPAARMDAGSNACMGVGIPFAIGAKLACPDRPVVVVAGDYGFSLTAMEMEACVRHDIPIIVIVANNEGNNGAIKQQSYFPDYDERITMFQPGLRYDEIMKTFGGEGSTLSDPSDLGPAITAAIASAKPTCINVEIDPTTPIPNAWGDQA